MGSYAPCAGPIDRRTWLKVGGLSLGALAASVSPSLAQLLAAEAADRDFSVILFWANGGPSHLETFDLKPAAPDEIRGPFRPTRTNVRGIDICELFPRLARMADRFTILRSLHHERGEHSGGTHRFLTGHASIAANLPNSENPEIGSIVAKHLEARSAPMYPSSSAIRSSTAPAPRTSARPMLRSWSLRAPISASGNNTYDDIPIYPPQTGTASSSPPTRRFGCMTAPTCSTRSTASAAT